MYNLVFRMLPRNEGAIYVNCHHPTCHMIVFLGFARNGNLLIEKATDTVTKHRQKHDENDRNVRADATWLKGNDLNYLWMGSYSRQKYKLVTSSKF